MQGTRSVLHLNVGGGECYIKTEVGEELCCVYIEGEQRGREGGKSVLHLNRGGGIGSKCLNLANWWVKRCSESVFAFIGAGEGV